MEDQEIIEKFRNRDEGAIADCALKYGGYLRKIAMNILSDREDAEEVLNDSYYQAWNVIPPADPKNLLGFLTVILRTSAIDLYRKKNSEKRRALRESIPLSELSEIASPDGVEEVVEGRQLALSINRFLREESRDARVVFVQRYYFMDSLSDISRATGFSIGKIKTLLHRTRKKLRKILEEEGYQL